MRSKLTQTTPQKIHIEFKKRLPNLIILRTPTRQTYVRGMNDKKSHHFVCIWSGTTYKNHTMFHRFYRQLRHFCATNIHAYLGRVIYIVLDNYFNLRRCTINASYCLLEEKLNQGLEFWIETGIESIMYYMLWYDFID